MANCKSCANCEQAMSGNSTELLCYKDAIRPVSIVEGEHDLDCYVYEPGTDEPQKVDW